MSKIVQAPASAPSRRGRARAHALDEARPAWRAGLAGTVAAHVVIGLLLWMLPEEIFESDRVSAGAEEGRTFEIELSPDLFVPVTPVVEPLRFVEVNPAAPENAPDNTPLFGAQNQQVAQPVPTPEGVSDTPKVDGEGAENATAIVRGTSQEAEPAPSASEILARAFEQPEPEVLMPELEKAEQPAARAVNAPGGGEQLLGEADGTAGTTVTSLPRVEGAESGPEAAKGTADGRAKTGGYFSGMPVIDRTRPQERPRLAASTINARNTPTIKNEFGSKNIGAVAYDAKWSAYGEYLQRLIDAVQAQWERLILRSSFYPTAGARVRVVFKLDVTGRVSEVVRVDGSGGELAQRLCVSAITERAPYGDWTDDMIAVLGREQEITFTFTYN